MGSDPALGPAEGFEVATVQPFRATKSYLCPGCNNGIDAGVGHLVIIPIGEPDLRRHWHKSCWANRFRRRPGRPTPRR